MTIALRELTLRDEPFLWEMLYHALHVPAGQAPYPREIIHQPAISCYVAGWSRPGDEGLAAYRGQGIGTLLLAGLLGRAELRFSGVSLSVIPAYAGTDNSARRLYERFVFEIVATYGDVLAQDRQGGAAEGVCMRMLDCRDPT